MTVRPSIRKVSQDLVNRSVTVTTGASTSSETLVTFINQPAGGNYGTLKVCKLTETPAYLGKLFSFSVNGGPLVSTEANDAFDDPANWSCRILGSFQVGSNVNVHEQIPAGTEVQYIDSDPATALGDFNTSTGDALITVGAGVTVVLYDDEPLPPSGTGWLEICKDAAWLYPGYQDPDVYGSFHFDVTDAAGATYSADVLVGQCSEPFQVAAGISEVTEGPSPGYDLVDVATIPEDRLLTTNLINRTADVEVPAGGLVQRRDPAALRQPDPARPAQGLQGPRPGLGRPRSGRSSTSTSSGDNMQPLGVWITAQAQTQCVIVGNFPIGSTVDRLGGDLSRRYRRSEHGRSARAAASSSTSHGPRVEITIAPGINTATITNTAKGLLEICKHTVRRHPRHAADVPRSASTAPACINVRAGTCTPPHAGVSVGTPHRQLRSPRPELRARPGQRGTGASTVTTRAAGSSSRRPTARSAAALPTGRSRSTCPTAPTARRSSRSTTG